jgi:uncharacterized YigZ family protein
MTTVFTIDGPVSAELEEKGSRFLGFLVPFAEFEQTLAKLRQDHRKASHHVTAFRHMLPDNRIEEGAKDDGEPAGTSGMPMLKVLIGANLVDAGVIVVRYFGGTKLGAGGLARAYAGTASRCIDAATLVPWHRIASRSISCPFDAMSETERLVASLELEVTTRDFTETGCVLTVKGPEETLAKLPDSAEADA